MKYKVFIIPILLLVVLSALMSGCKKKITEKIIEDTTGGKVDISKDTTTIKTEKGETKMDGNQKYVESIKELNYESVFETSSGNGFMYSGINYRI